LFFFLGGGGGFFFGGFFYGFFFFGVGLGRGFLVFFGRWEGEFALSTKVTPERREKERVLSLKGGKDIMAKAGGVGHIF